MAEQDKSYRQVVYGVTPSYSLADLTGSGRDIARASLSDVLGANALNSLNFLKSLNVTEATPYRQAVYGPDTLSRDQIANQLAAEDAALDVRAGEKEQALQAERITNELYNEDNAPASTEAKQALADAYVNKLALENNPISSLDQLAEATTPADPLEGLTVDQLVNMTIAGKFGNGADRRKALGKRYDSIQKAVNKKLSENAIPSGKKMLSRPDFNPYVLY